MLKPHVVTLIVHTDSEDKRTTQEITDMIIDATMAAALANAVRWNSVYVNSERRKETNPDRRKRG